MKKLREDFFVGNLHYQIVDKEDNNWFIYKITNHSNGAMYYNAFKFKTTKIDNEIIQIRPIKEFMKAGFNNWFVESLDLDYCYQWLMIKGIKEGSL